MKLEELAALLDLAEKHPRVTCLTIDGVTVEFGMPPGVAPVEEPTEEGEPTLPAEVYDPRKRLEQIHRKYQVKAS